ncbi:hypothetical protein L1887_02793 [Cichorium endivia]|nr:hypothetical protein L1887_02793 [Cichorium endivia]
MRFWSIVMHRALTHFEFHQMKDSVMAPVPLLSTSTFVMIDLKNFTFVGTIPEEMLEHVPLGVKIVADYRRNALRHRFEKKKKKNRKNELTHSDIPKDDKENEKEEDTGNKGQDSPKHPSPPPSPKRPPTPPSPKRPPTPPSPKGPPTPPSPKRPPTPPSPKRTSLPPSDDDDMLYNDDKEDLTGFVMAPFTVERDSDDDSTPMTTGQFKELSEKLDSLLESSKTSTSTNWQSSLNLIRPPSKP